jgi:hypothetical protein
VQPCRQAQREQADKTRRENAGLRNAGRGSVGNGGTPYVIEPVYLSEVAARSRFIKMRRAGLPTLS